MEGKRVPRGGKTCQVIRLGSDPLSPRKRKTRALCHGETDFFSSPPPPRFYTRRFFPSPLFPFPLSADTMAEGRHNEDEKGRQFLRRLHGFSMIEVGLVKVVAYLVSSSSSVAFSFLLNHNDNFD